MVLVSTTAFFADPGRLLLEMARKWHWRSGRLAYPLIKVNCAAVPRELPAEPVAASPETRPAPLRDHGDRVPTDAGVRRLEADNIRAALRRVSGPGGAAELLGIKPTTLASRIRALGHSPRSQGLYDTGRER